MRTLWVLMLKEWQEAWRDRKLIWLPVVITLLAVSQPITQYYMPEILDMAGNLPEGAVIEIPVPSGEEVLAGTLSQLGLMGTAIFVLSIMGSIAHERNNGALTLVMARPVQPLHYIASKWAANAVILLLSFGIAYGLSYYYTNLLFNEVEAKRFFGSLAVYSIWILFTLAVTLLGGVFFRKVGGISGASLVAVSVLSLCGSLFPKFMGWSPSNSLSQASHFLMTGKWEDSFGLMLGSSFVLLACLFVFTVLKFSRYESY